MKKLYIFGIVALTCAAILCGCGRRPAEQPQIVGVIDYPALYMNHPLAAEAHELEAKILFVENKSRGFTVAQLPGGINRELAGNQMLDVFFRQEMTAKAQGAQTLVENRKRQEEQALKDYVQGDLSKRADSDNVKAMELMTSMTALQPDEEQKKAMQKQLDGIFEENDAQKNMLFSAKKQAAAKEVGEYVLKVRAELDTFAASLRRNIADNYKTDIHFEPAEYDKKPLEAMQRLSQQQVSQMRKRIEDIKRKVDADIRAAAAAVAQSRGLAAVVGMPLVNIRYIDVTDAVKEYIIHGN